MEEKGDVGLAKPIQHPLIFPDIGDAREYKNRDV